MITILLKHMETVRELLISNIDNGVTFQFNKNAPIHRWYPYVEGFSGDFVKRKIKQFNIQEDNLILDPFVGCGTTSVEATLSGINSIGVEINPFMCFVSRTKTLLYLIDLNKDIINNTLEAKSRGAFIIGVSNKENEIFDVWIKIPKVEEIFYPLISVIPLQLLAYYLAIARGNNPDKPRNLAKAVTVK